jgi:streptogramin lyase
MSQFTLHTKATLSSEVIPYQKTSTPISTTIFPTTTTIKPDLITSNSVIHIKPAFGILSGQTMGNFTRWVTSGPLVRNVETDSVGNVFTTAGQKIARLNPITNAFTTWTVSRPNYPLDNISVGSVGKVYFVLNGIIEQLDTSTNLLTSWNATLSGEGIVADQNNVFFHAANGMGRLNPSTNTITIWSGLSLSSLVLDNLGNIYSGQCNQNGQSNLEIDRFDTSSNKITKWSVPTKDSCAAFLATDSLGKVYFTELKGSRVGQLDPSTNVITEWDTAQVCYQPFSIAVNSKSDVFFSENNGNGKLFRLVPLTGAVTEWDTSVFYITIDSSDKVYFTDKWDGILQVK